MESGELNKRSLESLIKAGALDSLGGFRAQYMAVYQNILDGIAQSRKNNLEGQMSLFDMTEQEQVYQKEELPNIEEYTLKEKLSFEKEMLGIYVSGHPLAEYETILKRKTNCTSKDFVIEEQQNAKIFDGQRVNVGGMIIRKSVKHTRANNTMAFLTLEDLYGTIEIVIFSNLYQKVADKMEEDTVVVVKGRASISADGEAKLIASDVDCFNTEQKKTATLGLILTEQRNISLQDVIKVLSKYRGGIPVYIYDKKKEQKFKADSRYWIQQNELLFQELELLLGNENVIVKNN